MQRCIVTLVSEIAFMPANTPENIRATLPFLPLFIRRCQVTIPNHQHIHERCGKIISSDKGDHIAAIDVTICLCPSKLFLLRAAGADEQGIVMIIKRNVVVLPVLALFAAISFTSVSFAQDTMKTDVMKSDTMKKGSMGKQNAMKQDSMQSDAMKKPH